MSDPNPTPGPGTSPAHTVDVTIDAASWAAALPEAETLCAAAARAALPPSPPVFEVSILLTGDDRVRDLNNTFRGIDRPTNVLSFPAGETPPDGGARLLGDIAVAFETTRGEAGQRAIPLAHHLSHLIVHGVLHLSGLDHETDAEAEAMEARETAILATLGIPDPYAAPNPHATVPA